MICPNCSAKIEEDSNYCRKCGNKVDTAIKTAETEHRKTPKTNTTTESDENTIRAHKSNERFSPKDIIQVVDNSQNKVIAKGQACYQKFIGPSSDSEKINKFTEDKKLISVDNKYFFKQDDDKYRIEKLEPFVAVDFIEQNYTTVKWLEYRKINRNDIDVFIENNVLELDKEVKNIVHTLNHFSPHMATIGSCSGHEKSNAWITLTFSTSRTLTNFLNIFEPYKCKMDLTTDEDFFLHKNLFDEEPFYPRDVAITLRTKEIGQPAYDILDDFDKYLKKIIKFRNRSYNTLDQLIERKTNQLDRKD